MSVTDLVSKTVRLPQELWEQLAARAKRTERSVNYEIIQAAQVHVGKVVPDVGEMVSSQYQSGTTVVLPTPTPARTGTDPDPEKKEKSKKEPRLAPLDVCTLIISDLNSQAGSSYRPSGTAARKLIALRMAEGNTVEDFYTVHRKQAAAWKGTEWARYLRPETLYGTKFEAYLGGPEPGAEMDPGVADALRMMGVKP